MIDLTLKGKTALIGGSSQGIGRAVAMELASLGATIILLARNEDTLKEVKDSLPTPNKQEHATLVVDLLDQIELKEQLKKIETQVNIIVNNSGGPAPGPANEAKEFEYLNAFTQHLVSNQVILQKFLEGMKASGYGRVINIISTSVKQPLPNLGVSNTVRAAVASWAKTLARELGPFGITVNNVLPGATNTARLKTIITNTASKKGIAKPEVEQEMLKEIPLGRFAEPEEIAYAVAFLASPAAAYVNGINLPVDGGRTLSL